MSSLAPQYYLDAVAAAQRYGVPSDIFTSVIGAESSWNANAYNAASGATGIAQFLPSTAANPGYGIAPFDPTDPIASLDASAHYMSALFGQSGDWSQVLRQYSGQSSGTPYANNAEVQSALANTSWLDSILGWLKKQGDVSIPPDKQMPLDPLGQLFSGQTSTASAGSWILQLLQRGGLFLVAIVLLLAAFFLMSREGIIEGAVRNVIR